MECVGVILGQAQNGLEFINAIAGAGFDIGSDIGKKLSVIYVLKLFEPNRHPVTMA